jgi:hypothetical protein
VAKFAGIALIPAAFKKNMATVLYLDACHFQIAESANAPPRIWTPTGLRMPDPVAITVQLLDAFKIGAGKNKTPQQ